MPPATKQATKQAGVGTRRESATDGTRRLLEFCTSAGTTLRVDREAGVIRGVKVLGAESANGRVYSADAMAEAVSLYNGRPVNVDHVDGGRRSYRDRIGRLTNVEFRSGGLFGDLVVNPKHPLAEQLFWDAEHAPENVGLSHDARGKTVVRGGRVIVEVAQVTKWTFEESVDVDKFAHSGSGGYKDAVAGNRLRVEIVRQPAAQYA